MTLPEATPATATASGPVFELDLSRLLAPRSVIVVGATDRPGSYAGQTLLNLRRAGYPGSVVGVHPSRTEVLGVTCLPTLGDAVQRLGGPADAVVLATPAASVSGYLADAGALGCGGAVVYAAGFGESGNADGQRLLVETAGRHRLPLLGPNGNGFVAVGARTPLWGDAVTLPAEAGPIGLITQSGNVGVLALAHRAGVGLHTVVSLGNAAVLDAPAVLARLAVTGGVRSVALYLEDDGDGVRLTTALAVCAAADVRVVVLKVGRSAAGREAAGAHTAALAGDHRVFAALIEEAGGVLARDPHDLFETARALAVGRRGPGRLAVLTASGGDAAIAADLAADAGVPLALFAAHTRDRLVQLLPGTATVTNPLDHTNLVWADTEAIAAITATIAADPEVGPVIYVQDEPPGLPPVDVAEWAATRAGAELGGRRAGIETLLVATTPGQEPPLPPPGAISGLPAALAAIAALRRPAPDPGRLLAIAHAARAQSTSQPGLSRDDDLGRPAEDPPGAGWLAEDQAKVLLSAAGVPVPEQVVFTLAGSAKVVATSDPAAGADQATTSQGAGHSAGHLTVDVDEVVLAARGLGFPVAVKLSAPGLLHKSEAGLLALGLRTDDDLRTAVHALLRTAARNPLPGSVLLLERMAQPGLELVLAAHRDGVVPALIIGLGGIWAEALDDVVVLPLPVTPGLVVGALRRLRAAPLLNGGRGRPAVDLAAIGEIAHRIGDLLLSGGFSLIEVNPLIVTTDGSLSTAVAVDALARR